ncbi:MAG: type IV secretion system protein VirB10 [Alphaproteobacteria bacterium]|nr:type IV secretion system protein VirB10 [Alphaproteobacteria bacterium]
MDHFREDEQGDTPDTPNEPIVDRGIPSVAREPKGQMVLMAIFLGVALIAIILVVMAGMKKEEAKSKVEPLETVFKSPASNGEPYIKPEPALPPPQEALAAPEKPAPVDTAAAQREMMMQQEALRMAAAQKKRAEERLKSPQVIYDEDSHDEGAYSGNSSTNTPSGVSLGGGMGGGESSNDGNLAFAAAQANTDVDTAHAIKLQHPEMLIAQGTMIAGILETAIQSDLPGMLRAIVSEDIYGFDGTELLIPRGSRLIGRYKSGLVRGQVRVFVMWNRILRTDGVSINLGSYGTDDLGRSGLDGDLDTHFLERFGSSILLSMIDTGMQIGANSLDNQNSSTVAIESGQDVSSAAQVALQNSIAIPPTIHVDQGKRIKVFVSKDLDFSTIDTSSSANSSER